MWNRAILPQHCEKTGRMRIDLYPKPRFAGQVRACNVRCLWLLNRLCRLPWDHMTSRPRWALQLYRPRESQTPEKKRWLQTLQKDVTTLLQKDALTLHSLFKSGLHGTVDGDMRTRSSVTDIEVRCVKWRQIHEIKVRSVGSNCNAGHEKRHAAHLFCQALTLRPHDRQPARFGMKRTCSNAAIRDPPAKTERNMLPSRELRTSLWNEHNIASCFKLKSWPRCAKLQLLVSILHTNHIRLLLLSWKFRPIIFQQGFDVFKLPTIWNAQTVIASFKLMILCIQASPLSLSLFGFQVS